MRRGDTVDLAGLIQNTGASAAVDAYFGDAFCQATPSDLDSLVIRDNWIVGPSAPLDQGTRWGIRANWLCGSSNRKIAVTDNYIEGFNGAALDVTQSGDVQVNCNTTLANWRAVDLTGGGATGDIRFKTNWLEVKEGDREAVRTTDALKTRLGGTFQMDRKDNGLMAEDQNVRFINDSDTSHNLSAQNNYWFLYDAMTSEEQFIDGTGVPDTEITSRFTPTGWNITWLPHRTSDTGNYCRATDPPVGSGGGTAPIAQREVAGNVDEAAPSKSATGVQGTEAPPETFLRVVGSSPGSHVEIVLGVGRGAGGHYSAQVFNVLGRRVDVLLDRPLSPGVYPLRWGGEGMVGHPVASGVYFVHARGPGFARTEKVILVR